MLLRLSNLDDEYTMLASDRDVAVVAVCLLGGGTIEAYDSEDQCVCPQLLFNEDEYGGWFKHEYKIPFEVYYMGMRKTRHVELISALCSVAVGPLSVRNEFDAGLTNCHDLGERNAYREAWYEAHKTNRAALDWGVTGELLVKRIFADMLGD